MGNETTEPIDAVLLFDECVPRMLDCDRNCESRGGLFCKHAFNFKAFIFYAVDMKVGRSDLLLTLHFLTLIRKNKIPVPLSPNAKLVVVTFDKKFFKSVKKQHQTKSRIGLTFDKAEKAINLGPYSVKICVIRCRNRRRTNFNDLRYIVSELNEKLS